MIVNTREMVVFESLYFQALEIVKKEINQPNLKINQLDNGSFQIKLNTNIEYLVDIISGKRRELPFFDFLEYKVPQGVYMHVVYYTLESVNKAGLSPGILGFEHAVFKPYDYVTRILNKKADNLIDAMWKIFKHVLENSFEEHFLNKLDISQYQIPFEVLLLKDIFKYEYYDIFHYEEYSACKQIMIWLKVKLGLLDYDKLSKVEKHHFDTVSSCIFYHEFQSLLI